MNSSRTGMNIRDHLLTQVAEKYSLGGMRYVATRWSIAMALPGNILCKMAVSNRMIRKRQLANSLAGKNKKSIGDGRCNERSGKLSGTRWRRVIGYQVDFNIRHFAKPQQRVVVKVVLLNATLLDGYLGV